jgi:uncharacterized protein (TIGR02145 family)
MKAANQILLSIIICFGSIPDLLFSQDIIVLKDGNEIASKVVSIKDGYVNYKKYTNPDGPLYSNNISEVFMIKYENGEKEVFTDQEVDQTKTNYGERVTYFTDNRDGRKYRTVQIGDQIWMAENMNYTVLGIACEGQESICQKCGQYYNYDEAMNICPEGWHLPSDDEWMDLEIAMGMLNVEARKKGWRGTSPGQAPLLLAGGKSGLDLEVCGHYWGNNLKYFNKEAFYWTSTLEDGRNVWIRHFIRRASIDRIPNPPKLRMSVRCIKTQDYK